jgi:hypothetical protein
MENSNPANNPPQVFKRECIAAVKDFRHAKPWRGNVDERRQKFSALHSALAAAYGLRQDLAFSDDLDPLAKEGTSRFEINEAAITLHGRLSVVTYFVAVGVARGFDYAQARIWGVNLYRRMFPASASQHVERDGFIVRRSES